jgi:hypothetical protein
MISLDAIKVKPKIHPMVLQQNLGEEGPHNNASNKEHGSKGVTIVKP